MKGYVRLQIRDLERESQCAKYFQADDFVNSILNSVSKNKIESYFILGGKLTFNENETKNYMKTIKVVKLPMYKSCKNRYITN
mgnify:CR=1 FL=1